MAMFKLPRLKSNLAIVNKDGKPEDYFLRLFNVDFAQRLEANENNQAMLIAQIQDIQAQQAEQLVLINQALELAGLALETADGGGPNKSGSNTGTFALSGTASVPATTVALAGVVAGNLTIPGTGPSQIVGTTAMTGGNYVEAEYDVVEVVSGVDTVVFTGTFNVTDVTGDEPYQIFQVSHTSAAAVAAFTSARTSTGTMDYRLDVRRVSGASMTGMRFYLFVRRAA